MDVDENQEQLLSNSSIPINDVEITEETPLTDTQPDEEQDIPFVIPESYDWNTSLISQICRDGDIYRLRLFIDYSRQMDQCAKDAAKIADRIDGDTSLSPLHHAARYQQLHICLMLLSNINFVFGVNIKDEHDRTPMHSAFRSSNKISNTDNQFQIETDFGNTIQDYTIWQEEYTSKILSSEHPLIYLFAKANGDINAQDKYLLTPLHYAVARNNLAGVRQLIILNAKKEPEDRQGIRPLHLACREGYLSIVEYLTEQGAKIDAIDADRWTPLHHACAKGHLDIVKLINSKENLSFQNLLQMKTNTNATCLHLAVQNGDIQLVEYILTEFTNNNLKLFINEQAEPSGTSLHIAARFCDPPMLRLLYHHEADPLILNSNGQSPLHIASALNRLSIVQELYNLTQSALLEIRDDHGQTALFFPTHPDIVEQLIAFGADISSLDNNYMNAIMIAVSTNQIAIVNCLLSAINDQSLTILDQVAKRNHYSIFLIAVQTGSIDMCSLLLTHPYIRWDAVDKHRMNAFHIATRNNHYELIQFLCNHIQKLDKSSLTKSRSNSLATTIDSDTINIQQTSSSLSSYIDAQNDDGKTPLHLAAEQGHTSCMQILLNYDANVLLENHLGQLPLHIAIQNGHCECVDLLVEGSTKYTTEFHSTLSRRQLPLVAACQNGFADIVQLLVTQNVDANYGMDSDRNKEENLLEVAIKHRQIETVHVLLEHPQIEQWLMPVRNHNKNEHQTPLRDMIRCMPHCAEHAFDRLISKTNEIDLFGEMFERTVYKYQYIDDYFTKNNNLYTTSSKQLYRNHPLIIALDSGNHSLLKHPLAKRLMLRKWKLYRPLVYFPRLLAFLLLFIFTFYVLYATAPVKNTSSSSKTTPSLIKVHLPIHWTIIALSAMNLLKIFLEIILYRGLRVPFAQLFGIVSFLSSIIAFIPYGNQTNYIPQWQWQLASFSILFQWFNLAVILRSVTIFGISIVMLESILIKFTPLLYVIIPLFIAFTIPTKMIFFNQSAFVSVTAAMHKSSSMIIGEFDYNTLFFSKATFTAAKVLFVLFIVIMTIVLINLLLGITVGDIQSSKENARGKANAYWIRELIYIESSLPSKTWLRSNTIEHEIADHYLKDSIQDRTDQEEEEEDDDEILMNHPHAIELRNLLEILDMLCIQTKQVLEDEVELEKTLKQLLTIKTTRGSIESIPD